MVREKYLTLIREAFLCYNTIIKIVSSTIIFELSGLLHLKKIACILGIRRKNVKRFFESLMQPILSETVMFTE